MCNCGKKRNSLKETIQPISTQTTDTALIQIWQDVHFEYKGKTAMTVMGSITGKKYRFQHPGDIQLIDYRDATGMTAIPVLRKIRTTPID